MDEGQLRRIYPAHIIRGCLGRRDSRFWPRQAVLHRRRCVSLLPGGTQAKLGGNSSCQQGLRDPPGCGEYPGDPETDQYLLLRCSTYQAVARTLEPGDPPSGGTPPEDSAQWDGPVGVLRSASADRDYAWAERGVLG